MTVTDTDLARIAAILYGVPQWRSQMARDLGISRPHMDRLSRGVCPVTDDAASRVLALIDRRITALTLMRARLYAGTPGIQQVGRAAVRR